MAKKKKPVKGKPKKPVARKAKAGSSKPVKKKSVAKAKKPTRKKSSKKKSSDVDLECFLTTACTHYYQLPDNSYELQTLRSYRDEYLLSSSSGRELVKAYYRVAPLIVDRIQEDDQKNKVYRFIYTEIEKACAAIERKAYRAAKDIYMDLVLTLKKKYRLDQN